MSVTKRAFAQSLLAASLAFASSLSFAQGASQGRIVVGNQPGGATDIVARLLAPKFSAALGHTYVVDNRTGASGNIAADFVAKAPADGNTILLVFNSHTTIGPLFPKLPFDPVKDFAAIGLISDSPYLVVARPNIGVDNLRDLLTRAKNTKNPITAGTPGQGTPLHLLYERMKKENRIDMSIVHYKGSAPAQADVMGGHVDITMVSASLGGPLVKSGKLSLLAVTSDARLPDYPNVPTAVESGVNSLASSSVMLALLVPAKTPRATIMNLNKVLNGALKSPDVLARLKAIGMTPLGGTPEAAEKWLGDERAMWTALIRESKITID
jgi:tripartite-type tricarboxylate transporter receptor subunit TctC